MIIPPERGANTLPPPPSAEAERLYRAGAALVRARRFHEALEPLEQALAFSSGVCDVRFARGLRSAYGAAIAVARGDVARGRRLCEESIAEAPLEVDLYVNLAQVLLRAGRKELAIEALHTARAIAPSDRGTIESLAALGVRRPPVLPFLARSNPINKYLGMVRHRFTTQPAHA